MALTRADAIAALEQIARHERVLVRIEHRRYRELMTEYWAGGTIVDFSRALDARYAARTAGGCLLRVPRDLWPDRQRVGRI